MEEEGQQCQIINQQYLLIKELGDGVQSTVYLGQNIKTHEDTAIKIYKDLVDENVGNLTREVGILQSLPHPNIIKLIDYLEVADLHTCEATSEGTKNPQFVQQLQGVVVLECANGGDLIKHIVDDGKFEVKLARHFFRQLIEGMEHCHSNGIIHRDLKPDNLLCTKKMVLKIADFGLAGIVPETPDKILKTAVGTMAYMAPELLEIRESNSGAQYQGEPVDIFSAGVILFTMVRGIMPFEKASEADSAGNWQKIKKGSEMGTFDPFWERHTLQSPDSDGLSDTFMRLIEGLLHPKPEQRWTIKQIKECAWYKEDGNMEEAEVIAAMKSRRRTTREKKQEKRNRIEKEKGKGYTRAVGDEEMKYDDEEHHELMRKLGKHNPKTLKLLSTQLFTNVHPIELKDKLSEQFDSIQVDFECPDEEEKPFQFKFPFSIENKMIPLENPEDGEPTYQRDEIGVVLDITDCRGVEGYPYKWCLEFRGATSSSSQVFYQAFNEISQILDEFTVPLNNEEDEE